MGSRFRYVLLAACCAAATVAASETPDEILLRSGSLIRGRILDDGAANVRIEIPVAARRPGENLQPPIEFTIDKKNIRAITRGGGSFFQSAEWTDLRPAPPRPLPAPSFESFENTSTRSEADSVESWDLPLEAERLSDDERRLASDAFRRLGSPDEYERRAAAGELVAIGGLWRVAVEVLRMDPDIRRRVAAADLLGEMEEPRATPALANLLDARGEPAEVQTAAWRTLTRLTGESLSFDPSADADTRATQAEAWRAVVDGRDPEPVVGRREEEPPPDASWEAPEPESGVEAEPETGGWESE